MNYYSHHIGDYLSATAHLTLLEHGAYRRLIDVYYIHEAPLPADSKQVYRLVGARTKEEKEAVDVVLGEFFEKSDAGWIQSRCDREIAITNKNRKNGGKGGRPPKNDNPNETQTKPKDNPNETQTESPRHPSPNHPITGVPHSEIAAAATEPPSTEKQEKLPPPLSDSLKARAKTIAGRLMDLESKRLNRVYHVSATDTRVVGWAAAGVKDPHFREAYDIALDRRKNGVFDQPISPSFMDGLIREVMGDEARPSPSIPVKAWHETGPGIEAKALELGLSRRFDEAYPLFFDRVKAAVKAAAGMIAEAA